jgi:secondary thiamine-phosphate synthase enzyme
LITAADEAPLVVRRATLGVETRGEGFTEITRQARNWLGDIGAADGLLTLFIRNTSASLTIQENADPDVRRDLTTALRGLAPEEAAYVHTVEGPDDMPAHIKTMLTDTHVSIPVADGAPLLGTWQGIYVIEHRARPHRRDVAMMYLGSTATKA